MLKKHATIKMMYDYLHAARRELEDDLGDSFVDDMLELAGYYDNWSLVDRERLHAGCEKHGHVEGSTFYKMWSLKGCEDIRVHIWHNADMLLGVKVTRVD